ncbi:hypothetical protein [Streptomyces sp. BPTC-684]|uniref:hypothetical protein n=1 Tax=Streptomyces sp. BPTC-684 TaxID=3043734 RepID=UPI0024B1D44A|nr:hypothetical protein [Streptomyces sp. BPTC-684]WHM40645.1 hypothetical protein QIY60_29755 [Streptomyces sp. BPTC-684]
MDEGVQLIDLADVVKTAPASLRRQAPAPHPAPNAATDAVVLVLDSRIPGFRAESALGSVLGPPGSDPALLSFVQSRIDAGSAVPSVATTAQALRRTDLDRDWLGGVLRKRARGLLYVGHVSGARREGGQSEDGALHLSCGAETEGLAEPVRTHRPLSAKDLLLGTLPLRPTGSRVRGSGPRRRASPSSAAKAAAISGSPNRLAWRQR